MSFRMLENHAKRVSEGENIGNDRRLLKKLKMSVTEKIEDDCHEVQFFASWFLGFW